MKKILKITAVILCLSVFAIQAVISASAYDTADDPGNSVEKLVDDYYSELEEASGESHDRFVDDIILTADFDGYYPVVSSIISEGAFAVMIDKTYGEYEFHVTSGYSPSEYAMLLVNPDTSDVITLEAALDSDMIDLDSFYKLYLEAGEYFLFYIEKPGSELDTSYLEEEINKCESGFEPIYSAESLKRLNNAYNEAKNLLGSTAYNQFQINKACFELRRALRELEISEVPIIYAPEPIEEPDEPVEEPDDPIVKLVEDYYAELGQASGESLEWVIDDIVRYNYGCTYEDGYLPVVSSIISKDQAAAVMLEETYGEYEFSVTAGYSPSIYAMLLVNPDTSDVITLEEALERDMIDLERFYELYMNEGEHFRFYIVKTESTPDKRYLEEEVNNYERGYYFVPGDMYSDESYERVNNAYEEAKKVLDGDDYNQIEVNDACFELRCAFNELEIIGGYCAPYLLGDANGDDVVDINDATYIQYQLSKGSFYDSYADVNQDRYVDINDVTEIQKCLAGYNVEYPINDYTIAFYDPLI